MKKTPLYDRHIALGARIIDFGGWAMPVQYANLMEEHHATRQKAGLFDICHMGEIDVAGPDARAFLQKLLSRDIADLAPGRMKLSVLTHDQGGILDDLTVYALGPDRFRLVTNASTKDGDKAWLLKQKEALGFAGVSLTDRTDDIGKVDLQGPCAAAILQRLVPDDLSSLKYYEFVETTVNGVPALVSRSGYTGEDGFEIYTDAANIGEVWDRLLATGGPDGLTPAGLGARDTLRLEAGMMLYGHEMDETVTPLEVVYGWVANLEKDFIGAEALRRQKEQGVARKLVGFVLEDRGIARQGYPVLHNGEPVGVVTSGTFCPTLQQAVGLAFVPPALKAPGTLLGISIRNTVAAARVVPLPFYKRSV